MIAEDWNIVSIMSSETTSVHHVHHDERNSLGVRQSFNGVRLTTTESKLFYREILARPDTFGIAEPDTSGLVRPDTSGV